MIDIVRDSNLSGDKKESRSEILTREVRDKIIEDLKPYVDEYTVINY